MLVSICRTDSALIHTTVPSLSASFITFSKLSTA